MASGETHIQGPIRESTSADSGVKKVWVLTGAEQERPGRLSHTWAGQGELGC